MPAEEPAGFVQSFARGLSVIRAFDAEHPQLTLSEVAARADITRAAAGRFLRTLEHLGYVRSSGREFALTPRVLELGFSYLSALSMPEVAQPHLEGLARQVGESVSAAVLDGADIVYVARVPTRRIMSVGIMIGTRFPAYATSMGRVLLAGLAPPERALILGETDFELLTERTVVDPAALARQLDEVAVAGYALADGELESGVCSVAVPVRSPGGSVVAAVNISANAARISAVRLRDEHLAQLRAAASAIEVDLRGR